MGTKFNIVMKNIEEQYDVVVFGGGMAGRNISVSHVALGTVRIMVTCHEKANTFVQARRGETGEIGCPSHEWCE